MEEAYIGEVRLFAGNFAPRNWAFCQGQLMAISQNTALFSILGTTYGGDGRTTFGLPDFRDHVGIGVGQGPGLSERVLGETGGEENVTLSTQDMPSHTHGVVMTDQPKLKVSSSPATQTIPITGSSIAQPGFLVNGSFAPTMGVNLEEPEVEVNANIDMKLRTQVSGGSIPHNNMQPYIGMNYVICLYGIFPPRW
ncbi:phage tail protein [Empedobacter falsenii]|uniref:phage tail protein n=1 Tax=Empedobacter falsenii TaxID=343874 RepID=UPI0025778F2A|nr:tail fiber protein [Empedobacter falsenii]MDM1548515.1 phage tail protein [Empedobacter falsenii]